jgi:hypothetical protein
MCIDSIIYKAADSQISILLLFICKSAANFFLQIYAVYSINNFD